MSASAHINALSRFWMWQLLDLIQGFGAIMKPKFRHGSVNRETNTNGGPKISKVSDYRDSL
eukprot:5223420-Karenia_brevis.AAC.1